MKRREFVSILGSVIAWPSLAAAQKASVPVIGFLSSASLDASRLLLDEFLKGLAEAGYYDRQTSSSNTVGRTGVMISCRPWPRNW